jgi:penicillin-binding protein 2
LPSRPLRPEQCVCIIVENGGGSSAASPIARAVIDTWLSVGPG